MADARSFLIKGNQRRIAGAPLGAAYPPLLDVILGVTPGETTVETELAKARSASELGVLIVTDVTTDDSGELRKRLVDSLPIAVRTVPTYDVFRLTKAGQSSGNAVMQAIVDHISDGVDSITIHASGAGSGVRDPNVRERIIPVTSRGGAMMNELALMAGGVNPYLEVYDEILDACREGGVALSLATTARPGSVVDALSASHLQEMQRQGELARRAHARGVSVVVELMGHVPLNLIPEYCALAEENFDGAPYGALGPCVTDIAMGHDDISGAIGAAVASMNGANFIACLTAGEHSHIPRHDELVQAIKNFQVAIHAGWIARTGDLARDKKMSVARNENNWSGMIAESLHPADSAEIVHAANYHDGQVCSMCGGSCPIVRTRASIAKQGVIDLPLSTRS